MGLIEFSMEEPSSSPKLQPRRYYRLTKRGREKPNLFSNPNEVYIQKAGKGVILGIAEKTVVPPRPIEVICKTLHTRRLDFIMYKITSAHGMLIIVKT